MPGPGLVFAFALATLYGALFHFIFGGDARRLAVFLLASGSVSLPVIFWACSPGLKC
ncbi:MAG: hypothetical protein HND48_08340 [Chloroflexi bacterium]|nr:hypothetical protein [Chloroflexota bacterium]